MSVRAVERGNDLLVVALADAGAEPDAVVVELHDAVVADVAVGGANGAEDVAGLAELEFERYRRVRLVHLHKVHARFSGHDPVLFGHVPFHREPGAGGNNAGFARGRVDHEEVSGCEQVPECADGDLPLDRPVPVELDGHSMGEAGAGVTLKCLPRRRRWRTR